MAEVTTKSFATRHKVPEAASAVTLDDTYKFGAEIYVGVTGDVNVVPFHGDKTTAVVFKNVQQGSKVPCLVYQVKTASTTATDLVALF